MTYVYSVCAVLGGTVLLCQFVMTLLGLGDTDMPDDLPDDVPHDVHPGGDGLHGDNLHGQHGHGSSWFFGMLTFRTIVAAMTFFGLVGLAGGSAQWPSELSFVVALFAGGSAMYGVHWMMTALHKLRADGTARIERSIGKAGAIYLRVPGQKGGVGKVHVNLQNRTMEYAAMTSGDALPAGTPVVVVDVIGPDTVEVELVAEPERTSHV